MSSKKLSAKVKSVLSGDTIILVSANPSQSQERQLSLAYVSAPRLTSSTAEQYAFESREFLRTLLVGKTVHFQVLYEITAQSGQTREYGDISAPIFNSLIEYSLKHGTVKLRDDASRRAEEAKYTTLLDAEETAKAEKLGLWGENLTTININSQISEELEKKSKVEPIPAIIERVINGDRLQVRILADEHNQTVANVLIAGIRAPRSSPTQTNAAAAAAQIEAEPYGDAAKKYVEARLLNRSVKVSIIGHSSTGVAISNIVHPAGNIAQKLVESGLAEISDWHSQFVGSQGMLELRSAERKAKVGKLFIWKDSKTSKFTGSSSDKLITPGRSFEASVSRIISGDTIGIIPKDTTTEHVVQLASIRGPRKNDEVTELYLPIVKEYLRKRLIGKHIHVTINAIRPKQDKFDERALITATYNDKNIALQLVEAGYAYVIKHRKDDDDRSPIWDLLLEKETEAAKLNKGFNSKKKPEPERTADASENASRAKSFLNTLQRQSKIPAIVEYVSNPSRFRLYVPREGIRLTLVLGGLKPISQDAPYSKQAYDYVNQKALQRDVTIDVFNIDRSGGFIGNLYLPQSKQPLSIYLVSQGWAQVHEYSADQTRFGNVLFDTELEAKAAKKGHWKNYVPEEAVAVPVAASSTGKKEYLDVIITEIDKEASIWFQILNNESAKLDGFMSSFRQFHAKGVSTNAVNPGSQPTNPSQFTKSNAPRTGDIVSAKFSEDKTWYRARILHADRQSHKYSILYIDFGNSETVRLDSLRPLPSQFSLSVLPQQAHGSVLTLIQPPPAEPTDYLTDARYFLEDVILGRTLVASIDAKLPQNTLSVTLYDPKKATSDANDSLNKYVVEEGWGIVKEKLVGWETSLKNSQTKLLEAQSLARSARKGCWEYGDVIGYDDE